MALPAEKSARRQMLWIFLGAGVVTALVASPTLYTVFGRGIGFDDIGTLWRFGPHQFFFTLFVVPFAALLTGCALWWTVVAAKASGQPGLTSTFARNWPIAFLWPIALAAFLAGAFFIGITWSPDKLRTPYAKEAASAIRSVEHQFVSGAGGKSPNFSQQIAQAKADATRETRQFGHRVTERLGTLRPLVRLQILLSGDNQRSLGLVDEATSSLSGLQVWVVLATGFVDLMCAAMVLLISTSSEAGRVQRSLSHARLATLLAAICLLIYPYVFSVYRVQLEKVVGGGTSNQDIVAAIGVGACFMLLFVSVENKLGGAPVVAIIGLAAAITQIVGVGRWELFRKIFGWDAPAAVQIAIAVAAILFGAIAVYAARPHT